MHVYKLFQSKLRKLLKILLEYIIDNYFKSDMIYNQNRNLIYFIKAPERYSLKYPQHLVIKALNNLINIAFYTSKKSDYIIHFVNQKAKNNRR